MDRCPDCGTRHTAFVNVNTFGLPPHEEHFLSSCNGRTWVLDKRTDAVSYRDDQPATA